MKRAVSLLICVAVFLLSLPVIGQHMEVPAPLPRTLAGHTSVVASVTFSPDGKMLASGSTDSTIRLWDVTTGENLSTFSGHGLIGAMSISFSPDGKVLASGSGDRVVRLWGVDTEQVLQTLAGHAALVCSIAFSPDGQIIASSGSGDRTIKMWEVATGKELHTIPTSFVWSLAFSPDGEVLASGSADGGEGDGTIRLWEVATGCLLQSLHGHTDDVHSVDISPDGMMLASGSYDKTIKLWNLDAGRCVHTLEGHSDFVFSVCFSPDGETLVSGSADGTVKLWDVASGALLRTLTGHTSDVFSVAFSPDGSTLASGSYDRTVLLWDVDAILHPNDAPTASFSWHALSSSGTRLVVEPRTGDRIEFDASDSSDPDGEIVEYAWKWDSNGSYDETTSDSVIEHAFSSAGSHRVTLRVTDDDGATATVTKTISIGAQQPPNTAFSLTSSTPSILDTVQFTDTSSDPDGVISSWAWSFGDGSSSSVRNPSHRFTNKGTFTVQLTVTDNDGLTDSTTQTVTVRNLLPEARFSYDPLGPLPHQPIQFTADESSDPDGEILSYRWDFDGDGSTDRDGVDVSWTFTEAGEYAVLLEVTDDDQGMASTSSSITLGEPPTGLPHFSNLWAVVIGVGVYEDPGIRDSTLMHADAQAVYDFLVDRDQGGFPIDHVRLLLDEQATQRNIQSAFTWLMDMTQSDDLVVVYFAGHGSYERDRNGDEPEGDTLDEFLLPYDTDPGNLFVSAIRDDEVGDWVASMADTHVVLIFDSCYAGGASRSRGYDQPTLRAGPGNTVFSDFSDTGLLVLAACQENETSKEDSTLGHGVFTYYLLRGLGGLADVDEAAADADQDGRVTIDELQAYLEEEVPRYVREVMRESPQNPLITGDEDLIRTALSGYGIPLVGEVTAIDQERVIISLGSRHGLQPGDRFEVGRLYTLPDGTTMDEVQATIEVIYILGPNRTACRVADLHFPIEVHDQVYPAQ